MPVNVVKNARDEKLWERAKKEAQDSVGKYGHDFKDWALVMHIFQNMKKHSKSKFEQVHAMTRAMMDMEQMVAQEVNAVYADADYNELMEKSPQDFAARYWLMQFCEPLSRKELAAVVNGFMIQLLSEEQSKALAKFLLIRFPAYYRGDIVESTEKPLLYEQLQQSADAKEGKLKLKPEAPPAAEHDIDEDVPLPEAPIERVDENAPDAEQVTARDTEIPKDSLKDEYQGRKIKVWTNYLGWTDGTVDGKSVSGYKIDKADLEDAIEIIHEMIDNGDFDEVD